MTDQSPDDTDRLRELVKAELEERDDVEGYEIRDDEVAGLVVTVRQPDETDVYHVTLETRPGGRDDTHWVFLGEGA